jgi:hypothetical protein
MARVQEIRLHPFFSSNSGIQHYVMTYHCKGGSILSTVQHEQRMTNGPAGLGWTRIVDLHRAYHKQIDAANFAQEKAALEATLDSFVAAGCRVYYLLTLAFDTDLIGLQGQGFGDDSTDDVEGVIQEMGTLTTTPTE